MSKADKFLNGKIRSKIADIFMPKIKERIVSIEEYASDKDVKIIHLEENIYGKNKFIAEMKNASVFSTCSVVMDKKGQIIDGVVPQGALFMYKPGVGGRVISYFMFRKNIKYKCKALSLVSLAGHCYYHWMNECLPRLFFIKDFGLLDQIDTIVLGKDYKAPFYKETLALLGAGDKNIVYIDDETKVEFDTLFFTSFPVQDFCVSDKWLLKRYSNFAKEINYKNKNALRYEKIYISRNKSKFRKTLNEDELFAYLEKLGYVMICLEDYAMEQQIIFLNSAKKIILHNGSTTSNIIFCDEKKASMLNIMQSIRIEDTYINWASILGVRYFEYIESNESNFIFRKHSETEFDTIVDIEKIKPYIEKLESE